MTTAVTDLKAWIPNSYLNKGENFQYAGKAYKVLQAHVTGKIFDSNSGYYTATKLADMKEWQSGIHLNKGENFQFGGKAYTVLNSHTTGNLFDSTSGYYTLAFGEESGSGDFLSSVTVDNTAKGVNVTGNGTSASPLKAEAKISSAANNAAVLNNDGIYVPAITAATVDTTNTQSITLTGDGSSGTPLQAAVNISATSGNAIAVNSDGLYVSNSETVAHSDTATAHITGTGAAATPLAVNVQISNAAGNQLTSDANGLVVPLPSTGSVGIAHSDTNSAKITGDGKTATALHVDVAISANAANIIDLQTDGLRATVQHSDTATVHLTGSATTGSPLQAAVQISGDAGNQIAPHADGLFVALPSSGSVGIAHSDTPTVKFTGDGETATSLKADVQISATTHNAVVANADGLYVKAPLAPIIEKLTVTAQNTLSQTTHVISTSVAVKIVVNHQVYGSVETPAPFTASGQTITWNSANAGFDLETTDSVFVEYYTSDIAL